MAKSLTITKSSADPAEHTHNREESRETNSQPDRRRAAAFLAELHQMTRDERISASRYTMKRWEYWIYAARFPHEVPTVNGELELIAATLE